jgi:putative FmdB family regulatory protein
MPTYEYVCEACDHQFEEFQSITAEPLKKCPECNKNKLKRLIGTGGALIFKGSGFYLTDYRSESYKKAAKADKERSSSSDSSSKSSGDSKSTKSESKSTTS